MKAKPHLLWTGLVLGLIHSAWAHPVITRQPVNQTNLSGTTVTFTVEATGALPLTYQWRSYSLDGTTFTNIPFATTTTLMLTNLQPTTRQFAVVVTDSGGLSLTSSPLANVTVLMPPSITSQPTIQIMTLDGTATFSVTAAGTLPLTYQWRFNDTSLASETNRTLVVPNVQSAHTGNYSVVVTNAFGSITSRIAGLVFTAVHRLGRIVADPDQTVSVTLAGAVPKTFAPYYDLYPVETSTNLVDWTPLATFQRTNNSIEELTYRDRDAANLQRRFYRTASNFYVTPFPKPSGSYAVGTFLRVVTDSSRLRETVPPTNSFMAKFWYPAEPKAGVAPGAYVDPKITLIPTGEGTLFWPNSSTVSQFFSHALPDAPLATNRIRYPVLLYSHGLTRFLGQNTDTLQELASHGYVVVAIDHTDAFASVFPNGEVVRGKQITRCEDINISMLEYRAHELRYVMDELDRLNASDALLAGRLDLERLGLIGKSVGGMTVGHVGRIDARCKAVVLLDAGITLEVPPNLTSAGLQKPFLSMSSTIARPPCDGEWLKSSLALFAAASSDAYWCQIQNSSHNSFDDRGSVLNDITGTGDPTPVSRAISQSIKACILSFFNKYLKGEDDQLLENPSTVHSNIINFKKK
jgi:hypothetical protein